MSFVNIIRFCFRRGNPLVEVSKSKSCLLRRLVRFMKSLRSTFAKTATKTSTIHDYAPITSIIREFVTKTSIIHKLAAKTDRHPVSVRRKLNRANFRERRGNDYSNKNIERATI